MASTPGTGAGAPRVLIVRRKIGNFGGGEWFLRELALGLAGCGFDVHLAAETVDRELPQLVTCHCTALPGTRLRADNAFRAWAEAVTTKLEPILVISGERAVAGNLYRAGDGVHAAWVERYAATKGSRLARTLVTRHPRHRYLIRLEEKLYRHPRLQLVVANSQLVADEIKHYHPDFPAHRVTVMHNALAPGAFRSFCRTHTPAACRHRLGLPENRPVILFAGNNFQRKGLRPLLTAVATLADLQPVLLVVGKGTIKPYQTAIDQLPATVRVYCRGAQPDLLPYYRAASLFALPTIYDPFSNVCLEAMAMQLPVITTSSNGFSEVIAAHQVGGVISSHARLDELLRRFLQYDELQQCRERIAQALPHYTMARYVKKLAELLRKLGR